MDVTWTEHCQVEHQSVNLSAVNAAADYFFQNLYVDYSSSK